MIHFHFTPAVILNVLTLLLLSIFHKSIAFWVKVSLEKKKSLQILNLVYVARFFSSHREFGLEKALEKLVGIVERRKGASIPSENSNGSKNEQQSSMFSKERVDST